MFMELIMDMRLQTSIKQIPRFGTNQKYKELVETAHEKGLKVVMDIIHNARVINIGG